MRVGIVGGTGPLGAGLALRLAAAGTPVVIGSRDLNRAKEVTKDLVSPWPDLDLDITGADNIEAAICESVFVATPWEAALPTVGHLEEALAGRVVISVGNALMKKGREFLAITPPRGSVTALLQSALPSSKVVGACHHLPAHVLQDLRAQLDSDVLVCADDIEAADATIGILSVVEGLRPIYAGSLAAAATIEAFTAILVTLNVRNKAQTTLKIGGLGERP
jgi:8-hydroxy-5-deazaflavin:NADPH oxidoreductase